MSDDPHYQREKEKYENPVASREYLMSLLKEHDKPLSFLDICNLVNAFDEEARIGIQRRLRAMEREGQVQFTKQKKYILQNRDELIKGRIIGHRDGYGFLRPEDKSGDLFISAGQMNLFLHDDVVEARISGTDRRGRKEAFVTQVIEPRSEPIVGRYFVEQGFGMVVPDDSRLQHEIVIPPESTNGARMGQVVVVELTQRPRRKMSPVGKIVEVLGEHMAPGMEIEMALRTFDIPHQWPKGVTKQVEKLTDQVPDEAKEGRIDLRQLPLVTIDGEDARDFDDAVYCEPLDDGGWQLWVAIADVSHYVRTGSALDDEAQQRGNSVYFPDQVIPMLPEVLSNGLCSLNPEVDRLCMVCEMTISANGKLEEFQFYEAVMNSHARLTYTKVWNILQGDKELHQRYEPHVPHLRNLHDLYRALKKARAKRGAIEFETQEVKFVFNAQRKIENIVPLVRNDAHKLIEEMMLIANVCVARMIEKKEQPALFRVHPAPDSENIERLQSFLNTFGSSNRLSGGSLQKKLTKSLQEFNDRPEGIVLNILTLRSMNQARYDHTNIGHFGLGFADYAHFTSPIRRYPDLVIHRILKKLFTRQTETKYFTTLMNKTTSDLDITDLLKKPIQKVSGGEMQRILLARALIRKPDLLVLDEPVQGVDLQGQTQIYDYINKIRHEYGCGILMVSHDLHIVMKHTDEVLCLNQHMCCTGHPLSVSKSTEFKALFGDLSDSLAIYEHHHDGSCNQTQSHTHNHALENSTKNIKNNGANS